MTQFLSSHHAKNKTKQPQERYGAGPASSTDNFGNYVSSLENLEEDTIIMEKATLNRNHYSWWYYRKLSESKFKAMKSSSDIFNESYASI